MQLNAIANFKMSSLVLLDGVGEQYRGPWKLRGPEPLKVNWWPNLPNLKSVQVQLTPYDRKMVNEPVLSKDQGFWRMRAHEAAEFIGGDIRNFNESTEIQVVGIWERQYMEDEKRAKLEDTLAKAGLVFDEERRRWVPCLPATYRYIER